MKNIEGKNVLILGLGESGLAMARWCHFIGAHVSVADTREAPERLGQLKEMIENVQFISGEFPKTQLEQYAFIAVSPSLRPHEELKEILAIAKEKNIEVISEIELFARALATLKEMRGYKPKIIAVTGTNGKTTTTSLVGHMCRRAGKKVRIAGNISPAALDVLYEEIQNNNLPDIWVLELSSFQLFTTYSLAPDSATVLNVTQDHLDWHLTMEEYAKAKERVFAENTVRVLNRDDPIVMAMHKKDDFIVTFGVDRPNEDNTYGLYHDRDMVWLAVKEGSIGVNDKRKTKQAEESVMHQLMPVDALKIHGQHNATNALAALALARAIGIAFAPLLQALRDYAGEPHRVEKIATINQVEYIDDSKGTNVGATVAAVLGLGAVKKEGQLILIAGGLGKGQDFSPLANVVKQYVKEIILIGQDANLIQEALSQTKVSFTHCKSLEEAVDKAYEIANPGDTVLLSPACASMDMFKNYAHRSQVFVDQVKKHASQVEGMKQ